MFNNLSKKLFLAVFVGLIIILVMAGLGCKKPAEEEEAAPSPVAQPVARPVTPPKEEVAAPEIKPEEEAVAPPEVAPPAEEAKEDEQAIVLRLAEKIAEIFGTWSTRDAKPYQNLKDLKVYGTDQLNSWLDTIIKDTAPTGPFHGWATKAISSAILESSADSMKILVTCKREEFLEDQKTPGVFYQMLMIDFKKIGEEWKVDRLKWLD